MVSVAHGNAFGTTCECRSDEMDAFNRDITYYPPKSWSIYVPTSLLCAFVAILFINGAMNVSITPKPDSIDTMWDEYSNPFIQGMETIPDE
jgi:PIG-P